MLRLVSRVRSTAVVVLLVASPACSSEPPTAPPDDATAAADAESDALDAQLADATLDAAPDTSLDSSIPEVGADASDDAGPIDAGADAKPADATVDAPTDTAADAPVDGGGDAGSLAELGPPRTSANVFYSGHSLVNLHMPFMVGRVAASLSRTHRYQTQLGNGSAMKARYDDPTRVQNRDGDSPLGFSILSEIPAATTIGAGQRYDTLVVTEAIPVFDHILYSDSTGYAGRFYDLLAMNGPGTEALLYEGWPNVVSGDHGAWISAVRADLVKWECILSKVNLAPARASNPMLLVPAGQALATLVREIRDGKISGLSSPSAVFADDIHLTNLGNYFVALVHHAAIYRSSPAGASASFADLWGAPYTGMPSAAVATRLQQIAWDAVRAYYAKAQPWKHSMAECRTRLGSFTTNAWVRDTLIPSLFPG